MDRGEGWTTRIGSSSALTQVQTGAGADHHRRRSELDRDLGGIMAVILGVEDSRTTDSIDQAEGAAEAKAAVHLATHFLPTTIPTATRLHLLTAGVFRVGRLHLTSGMRSRAATNLRTTRGEATATGARVALKESTTMVISPEAGNFTSSRRPAAEAVTTTKGTLPPVPTPTAAPLQRAVRHLIAAAATAAAAAIRCIIFLSSCSFSIS